MHTSPDVRSGSMDGAVDHVAGVVDPENISCGPWMENFAVQVHFDQAACGDFVVAKAECVDQEGLAAVRLFDFGCQVVVNVFVPAFYAEKAVAGCQHDSLCYETSSIGKYEAGSDGILCSCSVNCDKMDVPSIFRTFGDEMLSSGAHVNAENGSSDFAAVAHEAAPWRRATAAKAPIDRVGLRHRRRLGALLEAILKERVCEVTE